MKLNGISVEQFGVCRNVDFQGLSSGLNLVYGNNGSGKSTLARFINNSLFGASNDDCRNGIVRLSEADQSWQLTINDNVRRVISAERDGDNWDSVQSPNAMSRIDKEIFEDAFFVDGRNSRNAATNLSRLLNSRLSVPTGKNALEASANLRAIDEIRVIETRIQGLVENIAKLERQKEELNRQIQSQNSTLISRRMEIEQELSALNRRIEAIEMPALRMQIESLDREIADLRLSIEHHANQVAVVPQPGHGELAVLYRRLDEIDNQIRRWRNVHTDVQQQRIDLKDEMLGWNDLTLESTTHPYHRSRTLLKEIETIVGSAEATIHDLKHIENNSVNTEGVANRLASFCGNIRENLYALCDELGAQYKSLRHRNAAAELKRLRRCYHEISDNIEFLLEQHQAVVGEIRALDPAGAAAIVRAENKFCECAQHHGYLEARRIHIGDAPVTVVHKPVQHSNAADLARMSELETLRSRKVRQLVEFENEFTQLDSKRQDLIVKRDRLSTLNDDQTIRIKLDSVHSDLVQLSNGKIAAETERQRLLSLPAEPANPILTRACQLVRQLTNNRIRNIWLSNELNPSVSAEDQSGVELSFDRLSSGIQQQVVLSLCLAVVEHFRQSVVNAPMILDDVFVNLDPELIQSTFETLDAIANSGTQVVALTSDKTVLDLARSRHSVIFDLPETSVSPVVPLWTPDRLPAISPAPPESFVSPHVTYEAPVSRPVVAMTAVSIPQESNWFNESTELRALGILTQDDVNRMNDMGIYSVSQLLELNPSELSHDFEGMDISQSDVDRWQSMAWLMLCVPELDAVDAQILLAIGVYEPEQLESTHCQQLVDRISRYLNSADAIRFGQHGNRYNRDRINRWYDSLSRTRSKWRLPSGYSRRNRWRSGASSSSRDHSRDRDYNHDREYGRDRDNRRQRFSFDRSRDGQPRRQRRSNSERTRSTSDRYERTENRANGLTDRQSQERDRQRSERSRSELPRESRESNNNRSSKAASSSKKTSTPGAAVKLKFYLDLADQLEAAPSIGPKTAERFVKIGVVTVGDFLTQTAESMAPKLNYKRITADVIRQWQHQARLVCRVPNLRGHDAQLLVACGIIEAEDLAVQSPNKLFSIIQPFAESKDGLKIIRAGKQPDLEEVTDWINWSKETRSLQAA